MSFAPCQIKTKLVSQALISFWALDLSPSSNRKLFQAKVTVGRSKLQFEAAQSVLTARAFLLRIRQVNRDRKKGNYEQDWGKESKIDHCNFNFTSCRPLKLQFASGRKEACPANLQQHVAWTNFWQHADSPPGKHRQLPLPQPPALRPPSRQSLIVISYALCFAWFVCGTSASRRLRQVQFNAQKRSKTMKRRSK